MIATHSDHPAGKSLDIAPSTRCGVGWLADPDSTTVVYMGKRTFPALVARLIEHGMSPDTPALLAELLGHADEKLARMTIVKLVEQLAQGVGPATAVILFGALAGEER